MLCFRWFYFKIDSNMFLTPFLHRFFFHFGSQIPSKMHPKTFQKKHAFWDRFFKHFWRFLDHLGAILGPTWRQLWPTWLHFGRPGAGQNRPKSAKTAICRFFVPSWPPGAPRPPPDVDFFLFGGRFLIFFCYFSKDSCTTSAFNFKAFGSFLQDFSPGAFF